MLAQKTNATLQSMVDALKKEIVNIKLQLKSQKMCELATEEDIKHSITHWAKFFQLFNFAVLIIDSFKIAKPDFSPDDPKHYKGDNARLGPTAELYAVIPPRYMSYMMQFENLAKHVSESHLYTQHVTILNFVHSSSKDCQQVVHHPLNIFGLTQAKFSQILTKPCL